MMRLNPILLVMVRGGKHINRIGLVKRENRVSHIEAANGR